MKLDFSNPAIKNALPCHLTFGMIMRMISGVGVALMLALIGMSAAMAADRLILKSEVRATQDTLSLSDLVEGVSGPQAQEPVFRAPALGQTGTIQAARVQEAATRLGFGSVETGGQNQIVISRLAKRFGPTDIEAVVIEAVASKSGRDPAELAIAFDSVPILSLDPQGFGQLKVEDLVLDTRGKRLAATITAYHASGRRLASIRATGAIQYVVKVAVLSRNVDRGDSLSATDVQMERRPKDQVPADALLDPAQLIGRTARKALSAGSFVRAADTARPELVGRGELVSVVYTTPGMTLILRGKALEAGAQGDVINVQNPQSKRTLQATVVSHGRVSVQANTLPARIAEAR